MQEKQQEVGEEREEEAEANTNIKIIKRKNKERRKTFNETIIRSTINELNDKDH